MRTLLEWKLVLLVVLSLCVSRVSLRAQRPFLRHYTVQDGLPSNVIYDLFQDSKGFIWFSTNRGISCFDGHDFRNYSSRDGLPDNEVFSIAEDGYHRYWVICYNGKACYLQDCRVYNGNNDSLCRRVDAEGIRYVSLYHDEQGQYYLAGRRLARLTQHSFIPLGFRFPEGGRVFQHFAHDGQQFLITGEQVSRLDGGSVKAILDGQFKAMLYKQGSLFLFRYDDHRPEFFHYSFVGSRILLKHRLPAPYWIYGLSALTDTSIACCTEGGIQVYNTRAGTFTPAQILPAYAVSNRMMKDQEGNYWYASINSGVFMQLKGLPQIYNHECGLTSDNVSCVSADKNFGTVVAGYDAGDFCAIREKRFDQISWPGEGRLYNKTRFAYQIAPGKFIAGNDNGLLEVSAGGGVKQIDRFASKCAVMRNGSCFYGTSNSAGRYVCSTGSNDRYWSRRTTAIDQDLNGDIWLGTLDGLYRFRNGTISKYAPDSVIAHSRITSLNADPYGRLFIGTGQDGLYIHARGSLVHLGEQQGLSSANIRKVLADSTETLWISSDRGLDRLSLRWPLQGGIYHYALADGLVSDEINDFDVRSGKLYLATANGIIILADKKAAQAAVSGIFITSVNGNSFAAYSGRSHKLQIAYDQSNLQIDFTGIAFSAGKDIRYKYILDGGNGDTVFTAMSTLNFSALKPGSYRLTVWAGTRQGGWNPHPAALSFEIMAPFWLTPWFMLLTSVLIAGAGWMLYRNQVAQLKVKADEDSLRNRQIAELELQALRAQINPHFVFNALNSIQSYYSQHDERKANHYMTSFARFIRQTLVHARAHWLTLAEEVDMLRTYLDLEQMRFKNTFTHRIIIDDQIVAGRIRIPAMLIQPYIENAINHGLRNVQQRPGELILAFRLEGDSLICLVDDNGVGIAEAQKVKAANHQSLGMQINQQRIYTINQVYRTEISVKITDKAAYGQKGTVIELRIPLKD